MQLRRALCGIDRPVVKSRANISFRGPARMCETRSRLREMLNGPEMIVAPFVYDCLQAKLAQREGFKAIYMTGFGTAAARGFPDLGLLTMHEMIDNVRALARVVDLPLICDADTGY